MDKYNIITPTDNLDDLTDDMINWYQMPKKFRDAANDDCMRIYNCYVPQLYNRIKEKILQNMDYADIDDDNITIKESCTSEIDFSKYEKYEEKLKMSKKLQENPYIVERIRHNVRLCCVHLCKEEYRCFLQPSDESRFCVRHC